VKLSTREVHCASLKVGEWFGSLDLIVAPLDDHTIILRKDFLKLSKAVPVSHENYLMFLDRTKTCDMPMMTRRKLGSMPIVSTIKLIDAISESMTKPCVITQQ